MTGGKTTRTWREARGGPMWRRCARARGLAALLACWALTPPAPARAEDARIGKPLVQNYHHRDFRAEVQNWDVVQGDSGILYFANNAGVLEYDGRTWRLIELPSRLDVRALAKDTRGASSATAGRIYVGAHGDFGYLGPNAVGQLQFVSLLPPEAGQDKGFDQVFAPAVTPDGVYFQARTKLCRWADRTLRCRDTEPSLSKIFVANNRTYVQKRSGLMELTGDVLRPVAGGEQFTDSEVMVVLPYSSGRENRLLVGTRNFQIFVQGNGTFAPFAGGTRPAAPLVDELLRGAVLPDGTFVLATQRRGVLLVDREGQVLRQIDQSAGLQENHVHGIWPDRDGALWLALQNGVSRVDVSSPFSILDERVGLEREWRDVAKIQGMLYVRGYKGLYAAEQPASASAAGAPAPASERRSSAAGGAKAWRFTRVLELEPPVWSMVAVGDRLLASSRDGVFEVRGKQPTRLITYRSMPMTIYRSRSDPARVYIGLVEGVASLRLTDGTWRDEGRLEGIDETITSMAEGRNGVLWMVSQRQRILRVEFTGPAAAGEREPTQKTPRIRLFSFGRGALTGRVLVREIAGRPVFLSETGIFEFDSATDRFVPAPGFAALTDAGRSSFSWVAEDSRGDIWVASRRPGAVDILRRQLDGRYVADNASLLQMPTWAVYPEPDGGVVWLAAPDYLLRYDLSIQTRPADFKTLIRKVTVNEDEVVFGGASLHGDAQPGTGRAGNPLEAQGGDGGGGLAAAAAGANDAAESDSPRLGFPYRSNSLHFEFAAPRFEHSERSEFQSYLDGFDRHWSGWTKEPSRSYTNLPPGNYRFHVRARDARGVVGQDAVFTFSVLRPWYRSWLAYALYTLFICGAIVALWKGQLRRAHVKFQRELEHRELERLREVDRMKSRFFTDISHEFRTPLTLILGPIGQMLQEINARPMRQRLLLVRRNAEYLLRLISQLLDLSKVESGTMRLHAAEGDLVPMLQTIVMHFTTVAEQQGIDLRCETDGSGGTDNQDDQEAVTLYVDREVLEKIVNNLLTNACKFTPRGGSVRVRVRNVPLDDPGRIAGWRHGFAEIAVSDTGIGVSRDQLPHIFDRFYQGDSNRSREGIGVGLALVKELVELHGGTIVVESEPGKGTTFLVRLPKGRDHLTADEIVPAPAFIAGDVVRTRQPALASDGLPPFVARPLANPMEDSGPDDEGLDEEGGHLTGHAGTGEQGAGPGAGAPALDVEAQADDPGTVLVVEDHADVRIFLRDHLEPHYKVLEARDGSEGLDLAMANLPDLVLSDVMMGPMNGYELCKALKTSEKTCHIPVVLLTARAGRDDKLMGLDIGADCYLIKPFDPSELLVQVRNLIDQRRMLRERFSSSVVLKPSEMAVTPMDEAFLTRVLAVVEQNLSDPDFDVERLGREVGLSRSQLHRKLRALTNQPPTLLIRSIRLQRAAELLKQEAGSVAEVAYLVGFSSQAYFAKCFREQFGCAPREYARTVVQA